MPRYAVELEINLAQENDSTTSNRWTDNVNRSTWNSLERKQLETMFLCSTRSFKWFITVFWTCLGLSN